jgi:hypothetical protein
MTDLIGSKLHRLPGKLSGRLSRPGQQPYAAPKAIWAKPAGRMPRAALRLQPFTITSVSFGVVRPESAGIFTTALMNLIR